MFVVFFFKQKTAYEISACLVGSEMCIRDSSYGEYRALLVGVLRQLAEEGGWADFDAELAAISLSALLDGLWLESGLNPATFTPRQGVQICEAWVDGLEAGAHRRFRRAMEAC